MQCITARSSVQLDITVYCQTERSFRVNVSVT